MRRLIPFWLASLAVVGILSSALTRGQEVKTDPEATGDRQPRIVSGRDLGFRVEGMDRDGNPTGTLVVRIQGKWFDVGHAAAVRRLN